MSFLSSRGDRVSIDSTWGCKECEFVERVMVCNKESSETFAMDGLYGVR